MHKFNIFTLTGRYFGSRLNYFRPMRRLAQQNPKDFGKTYFFIYGCVLANLALKQWLKSDSFIRVVSAPTLKEAILGTDKTGNFINATITRGDDVKVGDQWYTVVDSRGSDLVLEGGAIVSKKDVLDHNEYIPF